MEHVDRKRNESLCVARKRIEDEQKPVVLETLLLGTTLPADSSIQVYFERAPSSWLTYEVRAQPVYSGVGSDLRLSQKFSTYFRLHVLSIRSASYIDDPQEDINDVAHFPLCVSYPYQRTQLEWRSWWGPGAEPQTNEALQNCSRIFRACLRGEPSRRRLCLLCVLRRLARSGLGCSERWLLLCRL